MAAALQRLDFLPDDAGFFLGIPGRGDHHLLAGLALRAQRLAEPSLVVGDEMGGGGKDVAGGTVVALEPDHFGAGEILLETQDVVHLGAAPAVNRLVVVTNAADVLGRAPERALVIGRAALCLRSRPAGCAFHQQRGTAALAEQAQP